MTANIFYILFAAASFIFPQEKNYTIEEFKQFDKLIGEWWIVSFSHSTTIEQWDKQNDSTLTGVGYRLTATDSTFLESLRLEFRENEIYYIAAVADQNDGRPIRFKLVSFDDKARFENKAHDYPQRIIYNLTGNNLEVRIEGIINGKERSDTFRFDKIITEN